MAMNLGYNTPKLFLGQNIVITNSQWDSGFDTAGNWVGGSISGGYSASPTVLTEMDFIDLGIVTDEREELTMGGIPLSIPGTSVSTRLFWAVGGKVLRVTISGIIPDGVYVNCDSGGTYAGFFSGKSNSSVFRFKLNKRLGYQTVLSDSSFIPNAVQYRRRMLKEMQSNASGGTQLAKWILTGYALGFVEGTRNLRYTLTLDLANNVTLSKLDPLSDDSTGILTRTFGDVR